MPDITIQIIVDPLIDHLEERIKVGEQKGLDAIAKRTHSLFQTTVGTWKHKPAFSERREGDNRVVETNDERYGWVNDGTKPHTIETSGRHRLFFRPGSVPKTTPNVVGAGGGSSGGAGIFRRRVRHPGIRARHFDTAIAKQVEAQDAAPLMAAALTEELAS